MSNTRGHNVRRYDGEKLYRAEIAQARLEPMSAVLASWEPEPVDPLIAKAMVGGTWVDPYDYEIDCPCDICQGTDVL